MPNNITNKIEFHGEQDNINQVLNLIRGARGCIDFNKIFPMPDYVFQGNLGPEERKIYGNNNWYDWSIANWGTKWNAYSCYLDEENNVIEFDSAWACPLPVLDKLAELCYEHNVSFTGKWADEDMGYNVGVFESDCDRDEYWFSYEYVENNSNEAFDIFTEVKGESDCLSKDADGTWIRHGCDNCPNPC